MDDLQQLVRNYNDRVYIKVPPDVLQSLLTVVEVSETYAIDGGVSTDSRDLKRLRRALSRFHHLQGRRVVE